MNDKLDEDKRQRQGCKERQKHDHESKYMNIDYVKIPIDIKLYNLVKELNRVGIRTVNCCQGEKQDAEYCTSKKAYISIDISDANIEVSADRNKIILRWDITSPGWVY